MIMIKRTFKYRVKRQFKQTTRLINKIKMEIVMIFYFM